MKVCLFIFFLVVSFCSKGWNAFCSGPSNETEILRLNSIKMFRGTNDFETKMLILFDIKASLDRDYKFDYHRHDAQDALEEFKDLLDISGEENFKLIQKLSAKKITLSKNNGNFYVNFERPALKDHYGILYRFSSNSKGSEICSLFGMEEDVRFIVSNNIKSNPTVLLQTYHLNYMSKPHTGIIKSIRCRINAEKNN